MEAKGVMRAFLMLFVAVAMAEAFNGKLTLKTFQKVQEGDGPSGCDGKYHKDTEKIVALSAPANHQVACFAKIKITAPSSGKSAIAKVVDQCGPDSGCEKGIVAVSRAVWDALDLGDSGEQPVTWVPV